MPGFNELAPRKKHFNLDRDPANGDLLFPEEFVARSKKSGHIVPNVPVELENKPRTVANTLGHPFKHHPKPKDSADLNAVAAYDFDRYAHLLMDVIRRYNRALYRLRRSRLFKDYPKDFGNMPQLPNEADRFILPGKDVAETESIREQIQDEFSDAATQLEYMLTFPLSIEDPLTTTENPDDGSQIPQPLDVEQEGNVDCIRINDYIVSVRIGVAASGSVRTEIPVSSSSFTSISSAFSSYSSMNGWEAGPE
jgi:hypothetical protein